jgi:hypothetical protein
MAEQKITFEESLEDDDWGLIVSNTGELKGLFIPDGKDDDDVPEAIVKLCATYFGVSEEEFYEGPTIH